MLLWSHVGSRIKNLQVKAVDMLKNRRKLVLRGIGALGFLCILLLLLLLHHKANLRLNSSRELSNAFKPLALPPEELFLLDEPDFLPEVLLEREPRNPWTPEDARPFWRDPLEGDPEQWRERIKIVIDELLEGVP